MIRDNDWILHLFRGKAHLSAQTRSNSALLLRSSLPADPITLKSSATVIYEKQKCEWL